MRRTVTQFKCDECQKEVTKDGQDIEFPYELGWIDSKMKMAAMISGEIRTMNFEGEFCNKGCLAIHINKKLAGANKTPAPVPTPSREIPPIPEPPMNAPQGMEYEEQVPEPPADIKKKKRFPFG
jgi:hypothetical protein